MSSIPRTLLQHTHVGTQAKQILSSRASLLSGLDTNAGCLFLGGLNISTAAEVYTLLQPLLNPMEYMGGTNDRKSLASNGGVLDAGTEPSHLHVAEHCEMLYLDTFPSIIVFACLENAKIGGNTTVVSTDAVEQALPTSFVAKLQRLGVEHRMCYGNEGVKTWEAAFGTEDTRTVEEYVGKHEGWTLEWGDIGEKGTPTSVTVSFARASYTQHPRNLSNSTEAHHVRNDEGSVFLSQTDLSGKWYDSWEPHCHLPFDKRPYSFRWGDGSEFSAEEMDAWGEAKERELKEVDWTAGSDLLILDNLRTMHGRLPFDGGQRRMAVMLGDPVSRVLEEGGGGSSSGGDWWFDEVTVPGESSL